MGRLTTHVLDTASGKPAQCGRWLRLCRHRKRAAGHRQLPLMGDRAKPLAALSKLGKLFVGDRDRFGQDQAAVEQLGGISGEEFATALEGLDATDQDGLDRALQQALAEAYGAVGLSCDSPGDVDATINKAMEINDVPVVVDFRVDAREKVFPMVPAGHSNDDLILHPTQQDRAESLRS